ncbi:hypothetical protein YSA_08899 [Pseudomonas putida ND6]|uniref:Uncharacterized protein n=1 Tax=Pseudomonas putida ND6 TaxID=231023 RepID=I3V1F9_PSEPU|nr:hypothetical protein YSA_08899 [Pseudomonas putida ND6]
MEWRGVLNVHFDMRLACPARCWMMATTDKGSRESKLWDAP